MMANERITIGRNSYENLKTFKYRFNLNIYILIIGKKIFALSEN